MGGARDPLGELRQVFREELEDHLTTLERERGALSREVVDPETARAAIAEIFRAVHSLKGAARAVEYPHVEQICHALEAHLGPRRRDTSGAAEVAALTSTAIEILRATAADLAAGRAPDPRAAQEASRRISARTLRPSAETTPAPAERTAQAAVERTASAAVERTASAPVEKTAPTAIKRTAPPRSVDAPPTSAAAQSMPAQSIAAPARPHGAPERPETIRVSAARLGELLGASEELLALGGRYAGATARWKPLDDAIGELRDDLRRARHAVQAEGLGRTPAGKEVLRRLDRGLSTLQTLAGWAIERQRDDAAAWQSSAALAGEIAQRSRALRVVPFGTLSEAIHRTAGEAAAALGKQVEVDIGGEAVEIDRRVRDGLREPLLHLVRNAIDHGIEPPAARAAAGKGAAGRLKVAASLAGSDLQITVEDDGQGIDLDAVRAVAAARGVGDPSATPADLYAMLYEPGFTTRAAVTAISGRGVGLDVVRQRVAEMHGRIELASRPGRGARFTLVAPLDLGIVRGLMVRAADVTFVVVTTAVIRLRRVGSDDIRSIEGRLYLEEPAGLVPLSDLGVLLGLSRGTRERALGGEIRPCMLLGAGERQIAVRVDELLEERDVVVRPLGPRVRRAAFVSGAAVIGDGEVALVLDVADLVRLARPALTEEATAAARRRRLLVVDDSVTTRQLERSILEAAGYDVAVAKDGQEAWDRLAQGEAFDLVVSDIEMPRLDGIQLTARIRASAKIARLPVVLVTALDSDVDRRRAVDAGASAYVVKGGFDQEALLDTLEQLL